MDDIFTIGRVARTGRYIACLEAGGGATMTRQQPDRRNLKQRQAISARVRGLLSSPSVLLTVDEAQRLLQLQREACQRILRRLLEAGVLREIQRGVYTPTALISGLPTP
jgi:Fic family protein